jgi:hypothetical protein
MSIRYGFRIENAVVLLVSMLVGWPPAGASANPSMVQLHEPIAASASPGVRSALQQATQPSPACRVAKRPKHTIRKCECSSSPVAGVVSVDTAEMLRLLTWDSGCRTRVALRN